MPLTPEQRQLVEDHIGLADRRAWRMVTRTKRSFQDVQSDAFLGLVDAAGRWDPTIGVPFAAYAVQRIDGQIVDQMRAGSASRLHLKRYQAAFAAMEKCEQRLARKPTDREIAEQANMTVADLHKIRLRWDWAVGVTNPAWLDQPVTHDDGDRNLTLLELAPNLAPSALDGIEDRETRDHLTRTLMQLPQRTQYVIHLYFWEELTYREIGGILGLTESRISQIVTKALRDLRRSLTGDPLSA